MDKLQTVRMWFKEDGHDKVYALFYNESQRILLRVWGRRGKTLKCQPDKNAPYSKYIALKEEKLKEGYIEVSDRNRDEIGIRIAIDEIANGVVGFQTVLKKASDEIERVESSDSFVLLNENDEVICVNVAGLDNFEVGVSYLFKRSLQNGRIIVEDMFGKDAEVFSDRFMIPNRQTA